MRVVSRVGRRVPVVSTAMGRAILGARALKLEQARAFLDAADCQGSGFINSFDHECQRVREQGYAVEIEENEPNMRASAFLSL
uniref:IclR family transcriptional regulator domain-containing protein n=1 Tax=Cutibacterium porci TaxID=2605781 RepID=UPI0038991505